MFRLRSNLNKNTWREIRGHYSMTILKEKNVKNNNNKTETKYEIQNLNVDFANFTQFLWVPILFKKLQKVLPLVHGTICKRGVAADV